MLAERPTDTAPAVRRVDHEAGSGDVSAGSHLVGTHLRRPEHLAVVAHGDHRMVRRAGHPQQARRVVGDVGRVRVRLAGRRDLTEERPDPAPVVVGRFADLHAASLRAGRVPVQPG